MILLQRIADEEFRLLFDEAPEEMATVATICEERYKRATLGMERPTRLRDKIVLRRRIIDQAVEACRGRWLLLEPCKRLGFAWEAMLVTVVLWIVRQLIEEWF